MIFHQGFLNKIMTVLLIRKAYSIRLYFNNAHLLHLYFLSIGLEFRESITFIIFHNKCLLEINTYTA